MKISKDYIEAVTEVNAILKVMQKEDVEKIPLSLRDFFENLSSKDYIPNIREDIPLKEQDLKPKTKALLGLLYRQFWCDDIKRAEFDEKILENDMKYKQVLQEMYSGDIEDIFKQRRNNQN